MVGDFVLLTHEHFQPLQWPLARVIRIIYGKDDVCRAATVRTAKGTYNRRVVKLCRLPSAPLSTSGTDVLADGQLLSVSGEDAVITSVNQFI